MILIRVISVLLLFPLDLWPARTPTEIGLVPQPTAAATLIDCVAVLLSTLAENISCVKVKRVG